MPEPVLVGSLTRFGRPALQATQADNISLKFSADFATEQTYVINLTTQQQNKLFGIPRMVFIDNGDNPNNVTINCRRTQFTCDIPAYANGFFPIDAIESDSIEFYSEGGAVSPVSITVYNYTLPAAVWYTTDPLTPGFDVQAVTPTATSITNRNTTLGAGVAANVFPSVASPRNTWFVNMTDTVMFYNVGSTATGSTSADKQLQPGQRIDMPYRTALRISFYSAAGGLCQAEEWTV